MQVPYARELPIYASMLEIASSPEWKEYFAEPVTYPLHHPLRYYYDILCGLPGASFMWQTEYIHVMENHRSIVEWYKGSGLPPFLSRLPDEQSRQRFLKSYAALIQKSYPVERDGKVLLPFKRVFFIVYNRKP